MNKEMQTAHIFLFFPYSARHGIGIDVLFRELVHLVGVRQIDITERAKKPKPGSFCLAM